MEAKIAKLQHRVAELKKELAASIKEESQPHRQQESNFQNYPNHTRSTQPPSIASDAIARLIQDARSGHLQSHLI